MWKTLSGFQENFRNIRSELICGFISLHDIDLCRFSITVKLLNFHTPTNFNVNTLKFKPSGTTMVRCSNDANGIAKSEDPVLTASLGAVGFGSALFA